MFRIEYKCSVGWELLDTAGSLEEALWLASGYAQYNDEGLLRVVSPAGEVVV